MPKENEGLGKKRTITILMNPPTAQEAREAFKRSHMGYESLDEFRRDDEIVNAYIDHAEKRIADSGWRSIESAPCDGTEVDLLIAGRRFVDCWWCKDEGAWDCDGGYSLLVRSNDPTHWMPIPNPPEPKTTLPAISKNGDGLKQGEWEYYLKGNRLIRIKRPITETRIGDGQWQPTFLDLSDDILISSEQNGWKRIAELEALVGVTQPAPDEWEYYKRQNKDPEDVWIRRINAQNKVECWYLDAGGNEMWGSETCSSHEIREMRSESNGWKRVEGGKPQKKDARTFD